MKLITKFLPADHDLCLMGDTHEGTILQHRDGIEKFKEFLMAKRNRFAVHMGDEVEAIMVDDPRYDPETVDSVPLQQMKRVIKDFYPIRKRMVAWLWGNHPRKLWRFGNITAEICRELEIEFATTSCRLTIRDKATPSKILYKCFLHHGWGSLYSNAKDPIQALANKKALMKRRLQNKAGDCVIMAFGHTHQLLIQEPIPALMLTDDGKKIKQHYTQPGRGPYIHPDHRWYVNTGSFLKLYLEGKDGYADMMGYDPLELGFPVIEVRDGVVQRVYPVVL